MKKPVQYIIAKEKVKSKNCTITKIK